MICSDGRHFLYPRDALFGDIDGTYEMIVQELERRNFDVPNVTVKFGEYGSGRQLVRYVEEIRGKDWLLQAGRCQGVLSGEMWRDVAALQIAVIPGLQLDLGESNPLWVYRYVGKSREPDDLRKFMDDPKYRAKQARAARTYVKYAGSCPCHYALGHYHTPRCRPALLKPELDDNREYGPEGDEPRELMVHEILSEFTDFFQDILTWIMDLPIPAPKELFPVRELVKFPAGFENRIFCFVEASDKARIEQGKEDPYQLPEPKRYALLSARCGISDTPLGPGADLEKLRIPGIDRERYLATVNPHYLNDIFVTDRAAYQSQKKLCMERARAHRGGLITEADLERCEQAQAKTKLTLAEYLEKGMHYELPVISVEKELSFMEVELLGETGYEGF